MTNIIHSKRGVSPLIATILLIAFAVALGAVVMNIGKSTIHGLDAGFSIVEIAKTRQICTRDGATQSFLDLTVQNGDTMDIEDFKLTIYGSTKQVVNQENLLSAPILKAESRPLEIPYDKTALGTIQKISLTPKMLRSGEHTLGTRLDIENIPACSS